MNLWQIVHVNSLRYEVLIPVSRGYPSVWGRLPTRYSPVRRSLWLHSTEVSFHYIPLDLHVLGTPPAFILSQDQTLFKVVFNDPEDRLKLLRKTQCVSLFLFLYVKTYIKNYCCFQRIVR